MKHSLKILFILIFSLSIFGQVPSPSPTAEAKKVFGHKYKKIYYVGDCGEKWTIPYKSRVNFSDENDAKAQGFTKSEKCTIFKKLPTNRNKIVDFIGDSTTRQFYSMNCVELTKIETKNRKPFASKDEAEKAGYKPSRKCTPFPNAKPSKPIKLGKPIRAKNLLEIELYLSKWLDKPIILDGSIGGPIFLPKPYANLVDVKNFAAFSFSDTSYTHAHFQMVVRKGKDSKAIRDAFIANNGRSVPGVFTFILRSKKTGRSFVGELLSYSLKK